MTEYPFYNYVQKLNKGDKMKASEIISRIEKRIEIETNTIEMHLIRRGMLEDILHMAKKKDHIEKKGTIPDA